MILKYRRYPERNLDRDLNRDPKLLPDGSQDSGCLYAGTDCDPDAEPDSDSTVDLLGCAGQAGAGLIGAVDYFCFGFTNRAG